MKSPRVNVSISEAAHQAIKRITKRTHIAESDLLRIAIEDMLIKYGEPADASVDRGGNRHQAGSEGNSDE